MDIQIDPCTAATYTYSVPDATVDACQTFGGRMTVQSSTLEDVNFSEMISIAGALFIQASDKLSSFRFPKLETIGGDLRVLDMPSITSSEFEQAFPKLREIGGVLHMARNNNLAFTEVHFP